VPSVRVLIVDDQEPFRGAAGALLEAMGDFAVVAAVGTGEESVEAVRRLAPDLVLMDVNLPGIDGLEATRRIRALDSPPVVVLVSTYEQSEYGEATESCGAAGYLTKSELDPDRLRHVWLSASG
jgi:DNA-binding NarL/FixJ family response regulator